MKTTADGFGFVKTAEGEFFIPSAKMGGAFDGDVVELAPVHVNRERPQQHKEHNRPGDKPVGRIVRIVDRAHTTLVGRYEIAEPFGVVIPDDVHIPYDIFTPRADTPTACDGDIVRVRITEYPGRNHAATGVVEEVLGHVGDKGVDVAVIIANHKLETEFGEQCIEQAAAVDLDIEGALAAGYADLRDRFVFTIDPVDARDFDDALSLEPVDDGWRLGVHIADVSRYVAWDSAIDMAARRRATSVYLVDRVIPMLPEALCEDICSLVPARPRATLSVDLMLDASMDIVGVDIHPSIIESKARLSYDQAQAILEADDVHAAFAGVTSCDRPAGSVDIDLTTVERLRGVLPVLSDFAQRRMALRTRAGGIDFDTVEAKVSLDADGTPTGVVIRERTRATSCVEEAMIAANESVAETLRDAQMPCIYRVHEAPGPDALAELVPVLQEFDYTADLDVAAFIAGEPSTLQKVLSAAKGRPEADLIAGLLLRCMKRACYRPACDGHYGLASTAYCHFTSPIRRYPDLVVHRMVHALSRGRDATFTAQTDSLAWLSEHASTMERIAEAAARESQEMKLIEYLADFIGTTAPGIVSGVATYGIYVRLDNTAEGLIPIKDLGEEYFSFDTQLHMLVGSESAKRYRMGQRMTVEIVEALPRQRRLRFKPA